MVRRIVGRGAAGAVALPLGKRLTRGTYRVLVAASDSGSAASRAVTLRVA